MWQPPLPNIGKVEVIYSFNREQEHFEIERYKSITIRPICIYNGIQYRFKSLVINGAGSDPTPMLFLGKNVYKVIINYVVLDTTEFGFVVDEVISAGISFENYLPQLCVPITGYKTIPRCTVYTGAIFEGMQFDTYVIAFPVDLDKNEFKVELNSVIFTLRLNRSKKIKLEDFRICTFDVIKAEFGEGLQQSFSESFVELKPKGE